MQVKQLLKDKKNYYIISEIIGGGELFELIKKQKTFSEIKVAQMMKQVLMALNYMHHHRITHRDLKPQNILLEKNGENLDVKIADFGFSCIFDPKDGLDTMIGTPLYMAPEILKKENYNSKVDIWSFGAITYMLLGGVHPFQGYDKVVVSNLILNSEIRFDKSGFKKVSEEAKHFVLCALTRDPKNRYSAKRLLEHPWMVNYKKNHEERLTDQAQINITDNFYQFSKLTPFQKTISSLLMGMNANKEDITKMKEAFNEIDTNHDGVITYEDL